MIRAYWEHPSANLGPCRVEHRWKWSAHVHWRWRGFRMWLGLFIAGAGEE